MVQRASETRLRTSSMWSVPDTLKKTRQAEAWESRVMKMMGESKEAFCTSHCIISVSLWLLTMRCVESCNCWLVSYETRSLSFIFTILSAVYDIPRSYCYSHALCPRNLYLYTTLACCHSLLVLLPFASAHPATYYYAYLPRIGILTDGAFRTALANGVLVRSLGAMV